MSQPKVFLSYSHSDERWKKGLAGQLQVLVDEGLLDVWDDRRIAAGASWERQIAAAIDQARVAVLLISKDFLTSRFVRRVEIRRLLDRRSRMGMHIVPVIVRACAWRKVAWLAALQVRPRDGKPLASFRGERVNQEMTEIAEEICDLVPGIRTPGTAIQKPRSPGTLPSIWNVPYNRNPNFTGRVHLLNDLRRALASKRPAALTQVMTGLGGVGKTQAAVEYAYRFSAKYDLVWWIRAEEATKLAIDYEALGSELTLPEKDAFELFDPAARKDAIITAVRRWLSHNGRWLLIFDNAQGYTVVSNYLPQGNKGHVIVTSRNPSWQGISALPVEQMDRNESIKFLLKRTKEADKQAAKHLAEALGDLPLALEQAGAYIEETKCSIADYAALFAQKSKRFKYAPGPKYQETVATTWEVSFEQVKKASPAAEDLLSLCAFLAPDEIPLRVLISSKGSRHLPTSLAKAMKKRMALDDVVASLRRYSLVKVSEDRLLSVHRLVQAVGRARLKKKGLEKNWAKIAVRLLSEAFKFDSDDVRTWPACSTLLPHVLVATEYAKELQVAYKATGRLLTALGKYSVGRTEFAKVKAAFEQALAIDEEIHGPDHSTVAKDATNLGFLLKNQGESAEAMSYFERALQINVKVYGANDPEVAISHNNIGLMLKDLGHLDKAQKEFYLNRAQKEFERALKINMKRLGPKHPEVAVNLNNLGYLRKDKGDMESAQAYFERALKINEAVHGADRGSVATNLVNLGIIFKDKGDTERARTYLERALEISEASYGPNHPQVATNLNILGYLMKDKGDIERARLYFTRALSIYKEAYGGKHPNVASTRKNLRSLKKPKVTSRARSHASHTP